MISIYHFTKEEVQQKVADYFNVPVNYIFLPSQAYRSELMWIKKVYIYCLWMFTDMTVVEMGEHLGKCHSVISHTRKLVNKRCEIDITIRKQIMEIESLFE